MRTLISDPVEVAAALASDPIGFTVEAAEALEGASAEEILRWAQRAFGAGLTLSAAMGDTVLAHLAGKTIPGVDVLFIDTGYHFAETLGTADAVAHSYDVNLITVSATESRAEHEAQRGLLYQSDTDFCCALRKVNPLNNGLKGYKAWATGLRRSDSPTRAGTPIVQWDLKRGLVKIAPMATWKDEDVDSYLEANPDVIHNPLVQLNYLSIGCEPCTSPVEPGEDPRSGRWKGSSKTECGIHYSI